MIEVVAAGNGFAWTMIGAGGRVLVQGPPGFPCELSAGEAAKRYRSNFWAVADRVDHRQGRAI